MICKNCGYQNDDMDIEIVFCPECGVRLEEQNELDEMMIKIKYCGDCGVKIPYDSVFCPQCGKRQKKVDASGDKKADRKREVYQKILEKIGKETTSEKKLPDREEVLAKLEMKLRKPAKQIEKVAKSRIAMTIVLILCMGFGIRLVIGLLSSFTKPTIDLNPYLNISVSGYDTKGNAYYSFDVYSFEDRYEELLKKKNHKEKKYDLHDMSEEDIFELVFDSLDWEYDSKSEELFGEYVDGSFDRDSELSNGDKITFKWNVDKKEILETYGVKVKYHDEKYTVSGLEKE